MSDADIDSDSSTSSLPPTIINHYDTTKVPSTFLRTLLVKIIKSPTSSPSLLEFLDPLKHISLSSIEDNTILELINIILIEPDSEKEVKLIWDDLIRKERGILEGFGEERERLEERLGEIQRDLIRRDLVEDGGLRVKEEAKGHVCSFIEKSGDSSKDVCYPIIEAYHSLLKSISKRINSKRSNDNIRSNALGTLHEIIYSLLSPQTHPESLLAKAIKNGSLFEKIDDLLVRIWNSFDSLSEQKVLASKEELSTLVACMNSKEVCKAGFSEEFKRFCEDESVEVWKLG